VFWLVRTGDTIAPYLRKASKGIPDEDYAFSSEDFGKTSPRWRRGTDNRIAEYDANSFCMITGIKVSGGAWNKVSQEYRPNKAVNLVVSSSVDTDGEGAAMCTGCGSAAGMGAETTGGSGTAERVTAGV
jgi:hypothetical protein